MSRLKTPLREQLRDTAPDEATQGRMWSAVRRRSARRPTRFMVPGFAMAGACALILWLVVRAPSVQLVSVENATQTLALADGSQVVLENASLDVQENDRERVALRLSRGRLVVAPRSRRWSVEAEGVVVRASSGRFIVAAYEHRAEVQVVEGEIELQIEGATRTLRAGERWQTPVAVVEPPPAPVEKPAEKPAEKEKPTWRALAAQKKYREAYVELAKEPPAPPRVSLDELIGRADVVRLSGHAAESLPILQRIVDEFPSDPRAALAAFTKGRVHADDLKQPPEAAQAFERAIALGLPRSLAEDAHARAVEAWMEAGDQGAARAAVQRYQAQFPTGKHLSRMQRWLQGP